MWNLRIVAPKHYLHYRNNTTYCHTTGISFHFYTESEGDFLAPELPVKNGEFHVYFLTEHKYFEDIMLHTFFAESKWYLSDGYFSVLPTALVAKSAVRELIAKHRPSCSVFLLLKPLPLLEPLHVTPTYRPPFYCTHFYVASFTSKSALRKKFIPDSASFTTLFFFRYFECSVQENSGWVSSVL